MEKLKAFFDAIEYIGERTLGKNWRTTGSGLVTLFCLTVYLNPASVAFLPDGFESWVSGISGLVALCSGAGFVFAAKATNVTGGSVPSTPEAAVRLAADKSEIAARFDALIKKKDEPKKP